MNLLLITLKSDEFLLMRRIIMTNLLPPKNQTNAGLKKVLKATRNHKAKAPVKYNIARKASKKTGLIK